MCMTYLNHEGDIISLFHGEIFFLGHNFLQNSGRGKSATTLAASLILTIITSQMKDDVLQVPPHTP